MSQSSIIVVGGVLPASWRQLKQRNQEWRLNCFPSFLSNVLIQFVRKAA